VVLWLSGLHVPETYLAALVQMACRKNNWPLDRSVIYTTVSKFSRPDDVEERPDQVNLDDIYFIFHNILLELTIISRYTLSPMFLIGLLRVRIVFGRR